MSAMLGVNLSKRSFKSMKIRFPFVGPSNWLFRPYDLILGIYMKNEKNGSERYLYPIVEDNVQKVVYEKYGDIADMTNNKVYLQVGDKKYKIYLFIVIPAYIKKSIIRFNDGKNHVESDYEAIICIGENEYLDYVEFLTIQEVGQNKFGWWVIKNNGKDAQVYINQDIPVDNDKPCLHVVVGTNNDCANRIYSQLLNSIPVDIKTSIEHMFGIRQQNHEMQQDEQDEQNKQNEQNETYWNQSQQPQQAKPQSQPQQAKPQSQPQQAKPQSQQQKQIHIQQAQQNETVDDVNDMDPLDEIPF